MIRPLMLQDGYAALPRERGFAVKVATGGTLDWLSRFYQGQRATIEEVYRTHFSTVADAVGTVMMGADRETATHEIFFRLINNEGLRRSFKGGDLGAWLAVVARHHAIDYVRRRSRESLSGVDLNDSAGYATDQRGPSEARMLLDRFQREVLPPEWQGVFEVRLLADLSQVEAAAKLGISRTTLAYRELRIRLLLRKFLLGGGP